MRICIIGGGVIGVTVAYLLANAGLEIILIEANQECADECSFANGGQLSYSYVEPLASPDVFHDLPKWLFKTDSPLKFIPNFSVNQWRWLAHFLINCNKNKNLQSTKELLTLSLLSQKILAILQSKTHIDFFHRKNGKLILFRDKNKFEQSKQQIQLKNSYGIYPEALDKEACIQLEPCLNHFAPSFSGGIYTATEEIGDCHLFTQNLALYLQQLSTVKILLNSKVVQLKVKNKTIKQAVLANGDAIEADQFIIANGIQSSELLALLNIHPLIYPLKGYSLSLPLESIDTPPTISITDYEHKIVYGAIGPIIRIAAMVDIGSKQAIDPKRVQLLKHKIKQSFPDWDIEKAKIWSGNRPTTPDSKPIIGKANPWQNLWLNIGHGSLGFTLACGSAELLKQLILGEATSINAAPFAMR